MGAEGRPRIGVRGRPAGRERTERAKEQGRHAYDRTGRSICAHDMQNMTFHDTSQEVPPARMTKHDIP